MEIKIGVSIIARNEEESIGKTIDSILNQTIKPTIIVVCNDGSTDKTKEIALSKNVIVVDFPEKHENWLSNPNFARLVNLALEKLDEYNLDYWMASGADCIYPKNYFEFLITKMKEENLTITSGDAIGEGIHTEIRGSGRIYDAKWWNRVIKKHPINYAWEVYPILKAKSQKRNVKLFSELRYEQTKFTGTNYTEKVWKNRGKAMKSLGYVKTFVIGKAILLILKSKQLKSAIALIQGYNEKVELCEIEVRNYVHNSQKQQLKLKNIFKLVKRLVKN